MTNGQSNIDSCPDPITHDEAAKLTGKEVRGDRNRLLERCPALESRIAQLEAARDGDIKLLTENIKERSEGEAKLRSQIDTLADMLAEQEQELAAARKGETTEWRSDGVQ